ncbi:hypothetical protein GO730_16025 [Spirosoma sp. HMF3257]|uniref:Wadjet protein JetD C-terminal domain-containing protein n=1 Tax=Spirosoma telluris TaxID=2183553 RepID=A0A327NV52_9BACT|nr:hypothetical protein [Spirosoma telluris]RAI78473.1 hypothetical protein HMF3257_15970 [Spirosoma telluris]
MAHQRVVERISHIASGRKPRIHHRKPDHFSDLPEPPRQYCHLGWWFRRYVAGWHRLASAKHLYYWGDLDAHGFLILDQCRKHFPRPNPCLWIALPSTHMSIYEAKAKQHRCLNCLI